MSKFMGLVFFDCCCVWCLLLVLTLNHDATNFIGANTTIVKSALKLVDRSSKEFVVAAPSFRESEFTSEYDELSSFRRAILNIDTITAATATAIIQPSRKVSLLLGNTL
jgi:hypothetical protein